MFDFGWMQDWIAFPDKVVPRWFGQDLSLPPDTEIRPGATEWADDLGAGCHRQGAARPTIRKPVQRKRRSGSRIPTEFDSETNLGSEPSAGYLPRKGAMFGVSCCGTESPTNETVEVLVGSPAGGDTSELILSPGVVLTDTVVRLQMEMEE